jgi:hypothetical protein
MLLLTILTTGRYTTTYCACLNSNEAQPAIGKQNSNESKLWNILEASILAQSAVGTQNVTCKLQPPNGNDVKPLIVLFTTFDLKPNRTKHHLAHRMVLRNWAQFVPDIQPVLFTEDSCSPFAKMVAAANWHVLPIPSTNKHGTPYLKPMYARVFEDYNATFYGYANGDILFDSGLVKTLKMIKTELKTLRNNVLVVGRRHNIAPDQTLPESAFDSENLRALKKNATVYRYDAEDYFIFTREGCTLNWSALFDVVIGRAAYDNYLLVKAFEMGVNVIDASHTLLAIHLGMSHTDLLLEDSRRLAKDAGHNFVGIGRNFPYYCGHTYWARFSTAYEPSGEYIVLKPRTWTYILNKGWLNCDERLKMVAKKRQGLLV